MWVLQVGEKAVMGAIKNGYVNKYRPYATSSLWAKTWEPRYVVVQENELLYYKSEKDMHYPPRGQIRLQGTYVDVEGLKRKKWWTFKIVDRLGVDLIRLSTESHSEMMSWIEALEIGGCIKVGFPWVWSMPFLFLHAIRLSCDDDAPFLRNL